MYALLNNYYNIIIMFTVSNVPFTKVLLSFYFLYPEEGYIINFDFDFDYDSLYRHSFIEDDVILDYPVTIEEVEGIVSRLRRNKASGKDEIAPEHLKFGGEAWVCQFFNAIISQETIPSCLKQGIVIPCYKGKGKDPLICRGITLKVITWSIFSSHTLPI